MLQSLLSLVNAVWETGQIPSTWTYNNICRIYKGAGLSRTDPKSYRPIAIISTMSKLTSKLIVERMQRIGLMQVFTSPDQSAYQQHKNRDQAVTAMLDFRTANRSRGVSYLFVDLTGAFDTVCHKKMLNILSSKFQDKNHNLLRYVDRLQSTLQYSTRVGSAQSKRRKQRLGVRQGDPLSPVLFNFYFDIVLQTTKTALQLLCGDEDKYIVNVYADDLGVGCTCPRKLNQTIKVITMIAELMGLQINLRKTCVLPVPADGTRMAAIPSQQDPQKTEMRPLEKPTGKGKHKNKTGALATTWPFTDHHGKPQQFPIVTSFKYLGMQMYSSDQSMKTAKLAATSAMRDSTKQLVKNRSLPLWLKTKILERYLSSRLTHNGTAIGATIIGTPNLAAQFQRSADQLMKQQLMTAVENTAPYGRLDQSSRASAPTTIMAHALAIPSTQATTLATKSLAKWTSGSGVEYNNYLAEITKTQPAEGTLLHSAYGGALTLLQRVAPDPFNPTQVINITPCIPPTLHYSLVTALPPMLRRKTDKSSDLDSDTTPSPPDAPSPPAATQGTQVSRLIPPPSETATRVKDPDESKLNAHIISRPQTFFQTHCPRPLKQPKSVAPGWEDILAHAAISDAITRSNKASDRKFFASDGPLVAKAIRKISEMHSNRLFSDEAWNIQTAMNGNYFSHLKFATVKGQDGKALGTIKYVYKCKCGKEADQHHLLTCDALRSYHDIARMMLDDFIKDSGTGPIFDNAAKEYNKALATIHQLKLTLTNKHGSDTATSEKIKRLINYPTSPHTHSTLNNQAHGFNPKLYSELRSTWNKKQAAERYINGFKTKATALTSELNLLLDEDFISLYLLTDYVLTNQGIPEIKIGTKRLSKAQCKARTDQMLQDKTVEHLVRPPIPSHGFLYTYYHLLLGAAYLTLVWRDPNLPRTATKATTTTSPITRQTNPFPTSNPSQTGHTI